jgi:hypothetical protein
MLARGVESPARPALGLSWFRTTNAEKLDHPGAPIEVKTRGEGLARMGVFFRGPRPNQSPKPSTPWSTTTRQRRPCGRFDGAGQERSKESEDRAVVIFQSLIEPPHRPPSKWGWWRASPFGGSDKRRALNACPIMLQSAHASGLGFYFKSNPGVLSSLLDLLYPARGGINGPST